MYFQSETIVDVSNGNNLTSNSYGTNKFAKFKLPTTFMDQFKDLQPNWGPLGQIVYKRTYSRIKQNGEKEEFWETIQRVVEGVFQIQKTHCLSLGLPWKEGKAMRSAKIMFQKIWDFKFSPPGRGLWMMGTEYVRKRGSMGLNSCGFVSTEGLDRLGSIPFVWAMDALMLGVGIGFDTKGTGSILIHANTRNDFFIHTVEDSREGWIKALKTVLDAYFLDGYGLPTFNFSEVRKKGLPIKGFGGLSSGPEPLQEMLETISDLLNNRSGEYIKSSDIVDIFNLIGRCVVSGNVRRSAEIALGELDDDSFINLKQDSAKAYAYRWASNNSVIVKTGSDYSRIVDQIANNGEPGLFWLENARSFGRLSDPPTDKDKKVCGCNPCAEQSLESFELCCLAETYPSHHDSLEDYLDTLKYAYMYCKTVTLMGTHWSISNQVLFRNRRMGISQSGIIDAFVKHGKRTMLEWSDKSYNYLRSLDDIYSDWLCIPKSIKLTSVKPSGTVSLLAGVSPGIHYPHSEYYIRRIRLAKNSPLIDELKKQGYKIENDCYSNDSVVVEFPQKSNNFGKSKFDVTIWEQFANAAAYQKHWADNQVSITISFKDHEIKDLLTCLETYEDQLKAVSLIKLDSKFYKQAPYEKITKEQFEDSRVNRASYLEIDLEKISLSIKTPAIGERFCTTDKCMNKS